MFLEQSSMHHLLIKALFPQGKTFILAWGLENRTLVGVKQSEYSITIVLACFGLP